jgi:hypothetical protein
MPCSRFAGKAIYGAYDPPLRNIKYDNYNLSKADSWLSKASLEVKEGL